MGHRVGLSALPTPLVVLCAGIMDSTLLLLQTPQKWQSGFWSFCIWFIICSCPKCACVQLFLVLYSFFAFCCSRCFSRCKHWSKGSQVPASPILPRDSTPLILKGLVAESLFF